MTALAVIEHLQIFKDRWLGCLGCVILLQRDPCGCEGRADARGHGGVPTVALTAPPGLSPVLAPELPRAVGPLRAAPVRRPAQPRRRLALPARQRSGVGHPLRPPLGGHRSPDDRTRAPLASDGEIPPAFPRGEVRHGPHGDRLGCWGRQLSGELVWGPRLGLPGGRRCRAPRPWVAASAGRRAPAAKATAADASARWGAKRREPAWAVGAPALGTSVRHGGRPLRGGIRLGAGWATTPRVIAPARDGQEPPQATHAARGVLRVSPGVLDGRWCAKSAAACVRISRASWKRTFAGRRRVKASSRCASWTGGS